MECLSQECEQLVQVNLWLEHLYYNELVFGLAILLALGWVAGHQR